MAVFPPGGSLGLDCLVLCQHVVGETAAPACCAGLACCAIYTAALLSLHRIFNLVHNITQMSPQCLSVFTMFTPRVDHDSSCR